MTTQAVSDRREEAAEQASWVPMIIIALAQIQLIFNVNTLQVSIGSIVADFNTTPSSVSTALVVYSLAVAGFVMLGAKLDRLLGSRLAFQIGVVVHGIAMGLMAISTSAAQMIQIQALAGLMAAAMVPSLVVLIATHYSGRQQAQALGLLGAAQAAGGVAAFLIVGSLDTLLSWRYAFGMLVFLAAGVFALSFRLKAVERQPDVRIDWGGALLAALSIMLLSLGFNFLNDWGLVLAKPVAPVNLFGLSPAPFMILIGLLLGQLFFVWSYKREADGKPALIAMEVLDTSKERAATYSLLIIGALGPAINFLIPLYIQIVQGRTSLQTAFAVIPYSLAIFVGTAFIVRFFDRLTPRQIGRIAFIGVAVGLVILAYTISNDWGTPMVILGLLVVGLAEGSLLTLIFNVLVSASPKSLAGDVGALRGTVNNLSTALGTALAAAFAVGVLGAIVASSVAGTPAISSLLLDELSLDSVNFVSNEELDDILATTNATPDEVAEAVRINEEARLRALKASFLVLAGIAALAIIPAGNLPNYTPGEIPKPGQEEEKSRGGRRRNRK